MNLSERIQNLTELWYDLVSLDHHKDRDCHWYINTAFSYGRKPKYRVEHYGYVHEDVNEEFDTYVEAESALFQILVQAIEDQKNWAEDVIKEKADWDDYQIETSKTMLKLIEDAEKKYETNLLNPPQLNKEYEENNLSDTRS